MGTVLSLSPGSRKVSLPSLALSRAEREKEKEGKNTERGNANANANRKKRHPVLQQALRWKKRLVAARAKTRKKVKPSEQPGLIPVPLPTVPPPSQARPDQARPDQAKPDQARPDQARPDQARPGFSPRRVVVQASTGELLRCLSDFLCRRCVKLTELSSNQIVLWFRNVDRALMLQGWQDQCFIGPSSLVFVYLLCREAVDEDMSSEQELHSIFLTVLYLAYSYLGNEISYPLKPFLVETDSSYPLKASLGLGLETDRDAFWDRALQLIQRLSADMLRINKDPHFFTEVFQDLKNQGTNPKPSNPTPTPTPYPHPLTSNSKPQDGLEGRERNSQTLALDKEREKENEGGNVLADLDR